MWMIGPLGITLPWLLLGLIALPILWLLLRAVPPAPVRRRFPGVALLLGLTDKESQSDRTPWWLMLLRMAALALVIIGFAGPILNPEDREPGTGPLLIVSDGTWAEARDWPAREDRIEAALAEASRAGRTAALVSLTDLPPEDAPFQASDAVASELPTLEPSPWAPDMAAVQDWAATLEGGFDTLWLSDGLAREGREALLSTFEDHGEVRVFENPAAVMALRPPRFEDGAVQLTGVRSNGAGAREITVAAVGRDPSGVERQLSSGAMVFEPGAKEAEIALNLPPELRNRVTRFEMSGLRSAGTVTLTDDALQRREVALIAGDTAQEGSELLSPLHYLQEALEPTADLVDGTLSDILLANPDVIVFADVATLAPGEAEEMAEWVREGGMLLRFAGPRLAASDLSRAEVDPLMPVRLRAGGRTVGGAMSWGEPKQLAAFPEGSPFEGLQVPEDVTVEAQVLAQPGPTLAERVVAQLQDGTPLVTRKEMGEGQVVLSFTSPPTPTGRACRSRVSSSRCWSGLPSPPVPRSPRPQSWRAPHGRPRRS